MDPNMPGARALEIGVLIVEDRPALKQGLRMRLAAETDLRVIGEASDCKAALRLMETQCPDIVLMDAEAPSLNGHAMLGALRSVCQKTPVILLTLNDDATMRARAADVGVAALVSKSAPLDALPSTIRQALRESFARETEPRDEADLG
jgi:DNA-binding NarL/FixJ family response regulator